MKILLLSPYHAKSHQSWCEGLIKHISADWTLLSLPPRHFSWRIRGNSLFWAFSEAELLRQDYDLIIATSMTDLNGLMGFAPYLAKIPSILYFHENQFAYPLSASARDNIEPKLVPFYAALSARRVCFNTQYNYDSFIEGAMQLLKRLPDCIPAGLPEIIQQKSQILSVPIANELFLHKENKRTDVFSILWNHRWEYDKWPECFFKALEKLKVHKIEFELHVLGEQFEKQPSVFSIARQQFSENIKNWGRIKDRGEYQKVLSQSHVVISTALHDFQGLSVLEAVAAGCVPIVPDRLAYVELFSPEYRYSSSDDLNQQAEILANHIISLYQRFEKGEALHAPDVSVFSWHSKQVDYQTMLEKLVTSNDIG